MNSIRPERALNHGVPHVDEAQRVVFDLEQAHLAQVAWRVVPVRQRLNVLRRFRSLAARHAGRLGELAAAMRGRPLAEVLTSEVAPMLDACRFLEQRAPALLAPRALGIRGRPAWLFGVESRIEREPLGVVLVIGPSNYPLFLPAAQMLQALAAGNAVLLKPADGGQPVLEAVAELLHHAGLDHRLLQVLPETVSAATTAIASGVNKVVLTGSAETGRVVMEQLAGTLTPAVMELSGCDAVFVREDADLERVVSCLRFGLLLNQGATCIAPRRVFVHQSLATELEGRLAAAFGREISAGAPIPLKPQWQALIREALAGGAHAVSGAISADGLLTPPLVLAGASPELGLLQSDVFAPLLSLVVVSGDAEALDLSRRCPYALGATVFGRDLAAARRLARAIRAGVVVVNDIIVPTADPRLPFGGLQRSGFGATRGAEGLLEMTAPKAIAVRRGGWLPHLDPPRPGDETLFHQFIMASHASGWRERLQAMWRIAKLGAARGRQRGDQESQKPG